MKMIEVLQKVANGEIEKGTKFILNDNLFIFDGRVFESNELTYLENCIFLNEKDLNREVELIEPKPKKYQLKLYEDDDFSYVARSSYDSGFNYDISDKNEICEFITKFTQEEIDNEKLLKFVEKYGIKEEVE
ncbi:hypothetical protein [Enterococcus cecorum]